MEISELLEIVVDENASDLHLSVGTPPHVRLNGRLLPLEMDALRGEDTERLIRGIASEEHWEKLRKMGGSDFGFTFSDKARFRVSIYKQKGFYGMSLRLIPSSILGLQEIGFNPMIKELLYKPRGLILVTGPTGSGKTTTLASMIDVINMEREVHILTVEDPIEYYHQHKRAVVTQRELGVDVPSFAEAIVRGVRMDPDVILVGEMRDLATMEAAITAAETGHLVFATLHTTGAARTVDRIIGAFPTNQQEQIRAQLATSLLAVISQLLLPRSDALGRIASFEIMVITPSIQNLIRENKTYRITSDIQTGTKYGMISMDAHLAELYRNKLISYDTMVSKAYDLDQIREKFPKEMEREKKGR
ncbi:MAG: type IV pilus twitching motility protein PilT [Chlamydiae bacterium]|nr:type IV pilus twitching motility protein PilT [Chlamydiota bacterium]MBI3266230.1 type IV pilus twitching motility protein PilT [Chlamydiota bacterium]